MAAASRCGLVAAALMVAACGAATSPDPQTGATVSTPAATASGARTTPAPTGPKPLPGLESLTLEGREKALFAQVVSQLYAPCASEAVSIQQCIEEKRPCAECKPAALLLGAKIHEGASAEDARTIYDLRFGKGRKEIAIDDSPTRGPANAPVTIVEFFDFECPHCKRAMPIIEQVLEKHPGQVRLVHKFYPLSQHAHAAAAAKAAIAAQNQGKYWEMEKTIFDHQDELTETDLAGYAVDLKLDMKRYTADIGSPRTEKILQRDHDEGDKAGLTGTPFILINGREFQSPYFHLDGDLDAWVSLEIQMATKR